MMQGPDRHAGEFGKLLRLQHFFLPKIDSGLT
jgi:hypothetical protein